jgi:hypothetical protein
VWSIRLVVLDRTVSPSAGSSFVGTLALIEGTPLTLPVEDAGAAQFSHIGVYNVDLRTVGVEPLARKDIPTALGRMISPDSFLVVLNPGPSHGMVILEGTLRGTVGVGKWRVTAYAPGANGSFEIRRRTSAQ